MLQEEMKQVIEIMTQSLVRHWDQQLADKAGKYIERYISMFLKGGK